MALSIKRCFAFLPLDGKTIQPDDSGYVCMDKKAALSFFYWNEKHAMEAAEDWAARNPKVPVLFLQSTMVIEAKKPETSTKEFKENGELIPQRKEV